MTMQDYFQQGERLSIGSVEVTQEDIRASWEQVISNAMRIKGRVIELKMVPQYSYLVEMTFDGKFFNDGVLYTMDDHGNKKKPSVFKLKE